MPSKSSQPNNHKSLHEICQNLITEIAHVAVGPEEAEGLKTGLDKIQLDLSRISNDNSFSEIDRDIAKHLSNILDSVNDSLRHHSESPSVFNLLKPYPRHYSEQKSALNALKAAAIFYIKPNAKTLNDFSVAQDTAIKDTQKNQVINGLKGIGAVIMGVIGIALCLTIVCIKLGIPILFEASRLYDSRQASFGFDNINNSLKQANLCAYYKDHLPKEANHSSSLPLPSKNESKHQEPANLCTYYKDHLLKEANHTSSPKDDSEYQEPDGLLPTL